MWRELEEDAIRIGLDLNYFWSLNVKEYEKHIKIYNEKQIERIKEQDSLNYMLGKYIAFAFNDPKHYPNKPFTEKDNDTKLKPMSDEEMERQARHNTIKMGGVINDSRRTTSSNNS